MKWGIGGEIEEVINILFMSKRREIEKRERVAFEVLRERKCMKNLKRESEEKKNN